MKSQIPLSRFQTHPKFRLPKTGVCNTGILVLISFCLLPISASAQTHEGDDPNGHRIFIAYGPSDEQGDRADSAYIEYKSGYNLILDEKWDEARRHFDRVVSRYSGSNYADDAQYWSAYALMHINRKKAVDAYRRFLRKYPQSSYFDDAVADFARLHVGEPSAPPHPDTLVMHLGAPGRPVVIDLQRLEFDLEKLHLALPFPPQPPVQISIMTIDDSVTRMLRVNPGDARHDRSLQLKIESLQKAVEKLHQEEASRTLMQCVLDKEQPLKAREYAMAMLTRTREFVNQATFPSLRKVVLDQAQPLVLRERAISCLAKADQVDVLPVLSEVARSDQSERSRTLAIEAIGQCSAPKSRTLEALTALFRETPSSRARQQETLLDAIADINDERAFDFIKEIAEKNQNEKVQNLAIYYLGEMDNDRDRSVETLSGLFKSIPVERRGQLETIMYSVANIGNDKAIDFLAAVARTGQSEEMRSKAVFYLTNIGGEKAREALYKVLERK